MSNFRYGLIFFGVFFVLLLIPSFFCAPDLIYGFIILGMWPGLIGALFRKKFDKILIAMISFLCAMIVVEVILVSLYLMGLR